MKIANFNTAVVMVGIVFMFHSFAAAHAFVDHAEPKVGSDVSQGATSVKIWFTQPIEPAFSKIQVFDSAGKQVDEKDSHADKDDHKLLIVSIPMLGSGTYKVVWKVVSVDTHHTNGDFKFVVR